MAQPSSWQYCGERTERTVVHDAGIDPGGFGAADSPCQPLPVLRVAVGFGKTILQDAGKDQAGRSGAKGPTLSWRQYCAQQFVGAQLEG